MVDVIKVIVFVDLVITLIFGFVALRNIDFFWDKYRNSSNQRKASAGSATFGIFLACAGLCSVANVWVWAPVSIAVPVFPFR